MKVIDKTKNSLTVVIDLKDLQVIDDLIVLFKLKVINEGIDESETLKEFCEKIESFKTVLNQ